MLLTTGLYYLGAWAKITEPMWSRYPQRLVPFMECAACTGMWYGIAVGLAGWYLGLPFLGLSSQQQAPLYACVVGLCSMVWTPPAAWLLLRALHELARASSTPSQEEYDMSNAEKLSRGDGP
jgi:hypothetical protein